MSDAPLVLAVPSKGRLQENAFAFFARAGLVLSRGRGARDYRGSVAGVPHVEVLFLSASEIVSRLATGGAHLGVTGEDLIREGLSDADSCVEMLAPLGFGQANVVVAVPQAWIDVRTMADLEEVAVDLRARHAAKMRVATKYVNLTRRFFAERGVVDYRVVESLGATEGTPAAGAAEIIVDITTTGTTLAANGLKVLEDGIILRSEANLVASLGAGWDERARNAARTLFTRIAAEEEARTTREIRAAFDPDRPLEFDELGSAVAMPYGSPERGQIILRCAKDQVFAVAERLLGAGARDVTVTAADYVFRRGNALADRLFARLP